MGVWRKARWFKEGFSLAQNAKAVIPPELTADVETFASVQ
jgi:hypothetical protein